MTERNKERYSKYIAPSHGVYAGIPEASATMDSIYSTLQVVRQNMETMLRQRGETPDSVVRIADLVQYDTQIQEVLRDLEARVTALEP